jgi:DNA-binding NtrC family response regulator
MPDAVSLEFLNKTGSIAVIDDEQDLCLTLKKVLGAEGYSVYWTIDPEEFLPKIQSNPYNCVLLDLKLGAADGIDYLTKIREIDPHLPIIMITAYETVRTAVEAMKRGAFHYLSKPFDNDELKALVANATKMRQLYWEIQELKDKGRGEFDLESQMGHSEAVRGLVRRCHAVAQTDVNVLLTGESGTGKELVAERIHRLSRRNGRPLVTVDCASIPESLIESELFGHEKGAFTGAHSLQKGKLERAQGGTLFLDEISNIPLNIQAKLLRFLETRTFERLGQGGGAGVHVSLRIIAATNRELPPLVEEGSFREDLFHRLNEFPIELPPLRERPEDIPYLSLKFLHEFEPVVNRKFSGLAPHALAALESYPWPGNVRELRNVIKQAMVVATGRIEKADLPKEISRPTQRMNSEEIRIPLRRDLPLLEAGKEAASLVEKELIQEVLKQVGGLKGRAAQMLRVDEKTLYNKIKEYKMSL